MTLSATFLKLPLTETITANTRHTSSTGSAPYMLKDFSSAYAMSPPNTPAESSRCPCSNSRLHISLISPLLNWYLYLIRLMTDAARIGIISAQKTRSATGRPRWKPRIIAASRNTGVVSQ